jgi:hypothetical protein
MRWRAVLYVTVLIVTTLFARVLVDWAKRASKKPPLKIRVIETGSSESKSSVPAQHISIAIAHAQRK